MKIGAVILAAGSGLRMGGVAKALLRRGAQTFLEHIIETGHAAHRLDEVVVVVAPPFGDAVAAHARELGGRELARTTGTVLHVVVNDDPARGMSSSINVGFAALDVARAGACDAAWLWPVDHPDVLPATLRALVDTIDARDVARPICDGRGGHPPLVRRALFAELARCAIARDVINAANRIDVDVADRGTIEDIDR